MSTDEQLNPTQVPENLLERQLAGPYIINLLFRSFRNLQAMIQAPLQERGHHGIGLAETRLLFALDHEGTRINTLAERTNTSRQFTSRVVHELAEQGYVRLAPDTQDGRATLVMIEERGWQYFQDIQQVKQGLDSTLASILGEERVTELFTTLQDLIQHTTAEGIRPQPDPER